MRQILDILVWGTGRYCEKLLEWLPDNCNIVSFIETRPSQKIFRGIPVASVFEFERLYYKTDFTIIAVGDSAVDISNEIFGIIHTNKNIYRMSLKDYVTEGFVFDSLDGFGDILLSQMFSVKSQLIKSSSYLSDYTICECSHMSFVVNSKYKYMLQDLSYEKNYQQEDIELFFELSQKYYGIAFDSAGIFMDIGANIGTTSLWVKKKINKNAQIVGFEPSAENCKQYLCNSILNGILPYYIDIAEDNTYDNCESGVVLIHAGVSNKSEKKVLMLSEDNLGDNRILECKNEEKNWLCENVQSITLNEWKKRYVSGECNVKWIWMDVQGHEGFCIEGGGELFHKEIPLYMEFWPMELERNDSLELLFSLLKEYYSKFICIDWYKCGDRNPHEIDELRSIAEKYKYIDWHTDIFLIK